MIEKLIDRMITERRGCLDLFLMAFIAETGARPSECVLIEQRGDDAIRWRFQKIEKGEGKK